MILYEEKYITQLRNATTDEERSAIINKIYQDGFEDGYNEHKDNP